MNLSDLIFTGFNKRVAALHRQTGQIVWEWTSGNGSQYVSLLLDGDLLVVAVDGYMYGLDAKTGKRRWANEMKGYGTGVTSLVSQGGIASQASMVSAAAEQTAAAQVYNISHQQYPHVS
jgi:outer membrane protein assembly factor BamB